MKTFEQFIELDEGRQAKIRAQRKMDRDAQKPGAIVPVRQGGARTEREAVGKLKNVKPDTMRRPPKAHTPLTTTQTKKSGALAKWRQKNPKTGFAAGAKQAMGGDVFSRDPSTKRQARKELGKKAVGKAKGLAGKAIGALRSKPPTEIEKASPLGLNPGGVNSKYSK